MINDGQKNYIGKMNRESKKVLKIRGFHAENTCIMSLFMVFFYNGGGSP